MFETRRKKPVWVCVWFLSETSSLLYIYCCCLVPVSCSQNSVGRFVPQFAKPRRAVTRLTATREEDLRSGTFSLVRP